MTFDCRVCVAPFQSRKARASHERRHTGPTVFQRFDAKVDRNGQVPTHRPELGPCWIWTSTVSSGYGRFTVDDRSVKAHRFSLARELGRPIAPGMEACHACDMPLCVRGSHLFEAPGRANVADRHDKGRDAAGTANGRARLLTNDVRVIRRRLADRVPWLAIAAEFGVSKGAIQAIASGRTWQHVQ